MSTPGGLFSYKASLSRGDQRHVRSSRRLQPKRVCLAAHPFGSRKWRSGLNGICHPDWVKFGVELNSAPKQNMRFSSSLHRLAPEFQVWNTWYSTHKIVREEKRKKRSHECHNTKEQIQTMKYNTYIYKEKRTKAN